MISILPIFNFHEVKIRTYLFIPIHALGLPFKHDLYSCLCDLNGFARGRLTPLSLYLISPGDGLIHVYSFNCCDTYICVKIQVCACTGTCTLVLVWWFKFSEGNAKIAISWNQAVNWFLCFARILNYINTSCFHMKATCTKNYLLV